jgi:predicted Zn-dependent peptidase
MATDKKRVTDAVNIVMDELGKIRRRKLSQSKLDMIKAQIKGNLIIGMESTAGRMNRLGRYELLTQSYMSMKGTISAIDKVKTSDLIEIARSIINPEKLTVTSLGPIVEKDMAKINWA